jgi:hypothetical protein
MDSSGGTATTTEGNISKRWRKREEEEKYENKPVIF